jgi:hypothetical protein
MRILPLVGILFGWFFASFFLLIFTIGLFYQATHTQKLDVLVRDLTSDLRPNYQIYSAERPAAVDLITAITKGDARAVLLDRFLQRQRSPMAGMGEHFVKMADKYNMDYRLLPAIAQKESGLGRVIPKGSYNAWGWAIYTGKNSGAEFDSWAHAIETVARGIKASYIDKGLVSPEQIMTKYTPSSDGSWAEDVIFTMNQIETGS